ncbi:hypothetical protein LNP04_17895 [Chryseobacterium sp. C-71]|uniref:hypothetical protein n=1 Tax=Chryseobacterium sp. C-71 TaxID=2893882 RepID=UPI001E6108E5|nr:hypothetical protein [Chryseobacterium sp. C-71]UFH31815.1 hypothetical protein LNP04_17895 [Chryseobacterium sp. C-71]
MRNFFLILLCFVSTLVLSQEYHFDYFVKEKSVHLKSVKSEWFNDWFYNSTSDTKIYLENYNNKTIAILYSEDKKLKHIFKVNKLKEQINFVYKHSRRLNESDIPTTPYKGKEVFEIKKLDSLKYSFAVFKDSKRKKKEIDAVINLDIGEFEYIDFRIDHIITREAEKHLKNLLNQNQKYIVRSVDYKYNSKYNRINSFESIQKVNLTVEVPEILKEPNHWSDFED